MRVIAGSKKGQALSAVPGKTTRPTTDKIKEAIFNLIKTPFFEGGVGLDLYAGTGALGIEALSRGLDKLIFIDRDANAIKTIKRNLHLTGLTAQSEVYKNDALRALSVLKKRGIRFDLILLDPPYGQHQLNKVLAIIEDEGLLYDNGSIVVETMKEEYLPGKIGKLSLIKEKEYGDTMIRIYGKESD